MSKHKCPNAFFGSGAKGGCYFEVTSSEDRKDAGGSPMAQLDVGWSCVVVHRGSIPVSWLSELVAIASNHPDGIRGFLRDHGEGGGDGSNQHTGRSYALMCDPFERQLS